LSIELCKASPSPPSRISSVSCGLSLTRFIASADCFAAHGAEGLSQDTVLASLWAGLRTLRFADGPDEVHIQQIGKAEVKREKIIREASARVEGMRQALESGAAVKGVKSML
jgi:hypothetical protein